MASGWHVKEGDKEVGPEPPTALTSWLKMKESKHFSSRCVGDVGEAATAVAAGRPCVAGVAEEGRQRRQRL
jgi:hypothetical protein